jgi:hypothetical protein
MVDPGALARVFGIRESLQGLPLLVAFIGAVALTSTLGPRHVFVVSGAILLVVGALGALIFRPRAARGFNAEQLREPER